jgi:two-component system, chemotaxis family, sensor kinase Cph1
MSAPDVLPVPDLANCAREPIHIPGAIQPHGVLIALDESSLAIVQVSENSLNFFGAGPNELLNRPIDQILPRRLLEEALGASNLAAEMPLPISVQGKEFDTLLHRTGGLVVMEFEPVDRKRNFSNFYRTLQDAMNRVQSASDRQVLYDAIARTVAEISGFNRVMVYKFDQDWNGQVVAEKLTAKVDSYLGQHFPASDIPAQARELYRRNLLRIIPNSTYEPARIVPGETGGKSPLDLSDSVLRSVSPIHLEYLRNMGVAASMSISLLRNGELWGLIACHHSTPRTLPYNVRVACEMIGQVASAAIGRREEREQLDAVVGAQKIQTQFFDYLAQEENVLDALTKYTPRLLELVNADGAALCFNDGVVLMGATPDEAQIREILAWVRTHMDAAVFSTHSLREAYPPGRDFEETASGLLAISLSREGRNFILWFRRQVVATIDWAGNPEKPVFQQGMRIHPRKSFDTWKQRVTGQSLQWREIDRHAAQELRNAINALILRRTDRLLRLNAELERKNVDLNSFAYIASHDLQEPLRGIREYSKFLLEDYGETIDAAGREKLVSLGALALHMQNLIESLSHFSRVGRIDIRRQENSLEQMVTEAIRTAGSKLDGVDVRVTKGLPVVQCDRVLVQEVLLNLLTNAVKYSDRPEKRIEIGCVPPGEKAPLAIYVKDNGLGIREKHLDDIFKIFRRLHPQERYGGGTGVGLAICKAIVERHGGRIWCESKYGEGTTFFFTLNH